MTRETVCNDTDGVAEEFTPERETVTTVESGTSLTNETRDTLDGLVQEDDDLLDGISDEGNVVTGAIAVESAEPGGLLIVDIEDVRGVADRGHVLTTSGVDLPQDHEDVEAPF